MLHLIREIDLQAWVQKIKGPLQGPMDLVFLGSWTQTLM